MEGKELREEIKRLKELDIEQAEADVVRLKAELEDAKTSDPDYEPPLSAPGSEILPELGPAFSEPATPSTPPNKYHIGSPVARPAATGGNRLKLIIPPLQSLPTSAPGPVPFVLRRNLEEAPVAAPAAASPFTQSSNRPTSMIRSQPSLAEIEKLKLEIQEAKQSLKPFSAIPQNLPFAYRDEIQRKVMTLQRQLDEWMGTGNSEATHFDQTAPCMNRSTLSMNASANSAGPSGTRTTPRTGSTPILPNMTCIEMDIDIKPKIEPGMDIKPVVMGGNRWAYLQPTVVINQADPRDGGMDHEQKPRKVEFADTGRRLKVCDHSILVV